MEAGKNAKIKTYLIDKFIANIRKARSKK